MTVYSKNPEWPDLPFAWPKAYGESREGRGWPLPLPRLIVVHYTAGREDITSAENGAGYDQIRIDGVSAHYYVDPDSIVQCVPTWMRSNTAYRNGNTLGIHYELCGTLQTRAQWLDPASREIIRRAAWQMARDAAKWNIPLRKLTPAQVRAGELGYCGHGDVTLAFPEDGGDHMDPGPAYPWDVLFADIKDFQTHGSEIDVALSSQDLQNLTISVWQNFLAPGGINMQDHLLRIDSGVQQLLARPVAGALTDEQFDAFIAAVSAAVVAADNPLGEDDEPAIRDAVQDVLKTLRIAVEDAEQ